MDKDIIGWIIFATICLLGLLSVSIPMTIVSIKNQEKEIELEKYKIEYQLKNGDVGNDRDN